MRIVIVAGQSNMVGYRTSLQDLAPRWRKPLPECFYWEGSRWIPLQANKLNQKSAFGPELSIAQFLSETDGAPIGIVKVAKNGSYLERNWSPLKKNKLFDKLIGQTQAALASGPSHLCGLIWLQGEADSIDQQDAVQYRKRFTTLIKQLRISLSAPKLPVVAGIVNPVTEKCQYRNRVRRALAQAPLENYSTVGFDDLPLLPDQLHLTPNSLGKLGKRFAKKMLDFPTPTLVNHWIWNSPNYQCWYTGPQEVPDHVIVSFPFAVAKSGYNEFGFGQPAFDKREVGTIYIRSNLSNWFQHDEVFTLARRIRDYIGDDARVSLYGASMGAYGALLLSKALKPQRIFAIAPQYSIDRKIVPWETRWSRAAGRIKNFQHDLIENIDPRARKFVFYDSTSVDRRHVDLMPLDDTWTLVKLPYASHQVLRYLRETGSLSLLVDALVNEAPVIDDLVVKSRSNRKASSIYWMTLAKLSADRRPRLALSAFDQAIQCGGPKSKIQVHIDRITALL